jgi:peptidyl-prolyl cis-trans isomerase C
MKLVSICVSIIALTLVTVVSKAEDKVSDLEILAKRGKGVVSQKSFNARAAKIPPESRQAALRNGGRLKSVINTMLLKAQLAEDAREAGFDKDQTVIDRMQLAAESELAEAWIERYIELQPAGDYEQLALEYYELNKHSLMSELTIDVSHILVSLDDHTDEEASKLADSVYSEAIASPASFDDLIQTYSEDPSSASNKGRFSKVKRGDMVKSFEDAAFNLGSGDISPPVKTEYGYHIIRLDAYNEGIQQPFDNVKEAIMSGQRKKHAERIKNDYLGSLTALDVEMTKEALEEMVRRQFGEDAVETESASDDSE